MRTFAHRWRLSKGMQVQLGSFSLYVLPLPSDEGQ